MVHCIFKLSSSYSAILVIRTVRVHDSTQVTIVVSFLVPGERAAVSFHRGRNLSARSQGHVVRTKPGKKGQVNGMYIVQPDLVIVQGSRADLRQLDFYVHDSWPTGLRV